MEIIRRL